MSDLEIPRGRPFLTARWSNLILANFATPDELLLPRLPDGLQLDRRDGRAWTSLVAFDFLDTRVLGVPWPGYRNFPEINLRFYVRHGRDRGVVFVREFVPKRFVALMTRLLYREPYAAVPMSSVVVESAETITVEHRLSVGGREHSIRATGTKPPVRPAADSLEHFFKEHEWGYGRSRRGTTLRYAVRHPPWSIYPLRACAVEFDWALLFGAEWAVMNGVPPDSAILADGSKVQVYPRSRPVEPVEPGMLRQPLASPVAG